MAILSNFYASRDISAAPLLELLLDAGASANSPPSEEYTSPLHAAIHNRHYAFALRLLDNGADANAQDPRFGTPLTAASFRGEVELMRKLVEMGADPSLAGQKYGSVSRSLPQSNDRLTTIEALLSKPPPEAGASLPPHTSSPSPLSTSTSAPANEGSPCTPPAASSAATTWCGCYWPTGPL